MPQLFQVLKCFKCSVFQVHQTKKSSKWQCKLCGEKQSIKRHYGLGTGKECRLHVQKLNSVRGEVDELNETAKLNESSDEELSAKHELNVLGNKDENLSKWSEFVDNTETIEAPEPEPLCFGNAEVVLEIPSKRRRKFIKPRATKSAASTEPNPSNTDNLCSIQQSYISPLVDVQKNLPIVVQNVQSIEVSKQTEFKPTTKANMPHKIDKNSKWAQFADESEEEHCTSDDDQSPLCKYDMSTVSNDPASSNNDRGIDTRKNNDGDLNSCKIENVPNVSDEDVPKNIFSLCNENDIDEVLDF